MLRDIVKGKKKDSSFIQRNVRMKKGFFYLHICNQFNSDVYKNAYRTMLISSCVLLNYLDGSLGQDYPDKQNGDVWYLKWQA